MSQWADCSDAERAKVHNINLAIQDMADPCQLAQQWGVSMSQLWAFEVRDGQTNQMMNDFWLPRTPDLARLLVAAKPKPKRRARVARKAKPKRTARRKR
jgi:hypothetical protein